MYFLQIVNRFCLFVCYWGSLHPEGYFFRYTHDEHAHTNRHIHNRLISVCAQQDRLKLIKRPSSCSGSQHSTTMIDQVFWQDWPHRTLKVTLSRKWRNPWKDWATVHFYRWWTLIMVVKVITRQYSIFPNKGYTKEYKSSPQPRESKNQVSRKYNTHPASLSQEESAWRWHIRLLLPHYFYLPVCTLL